MSDGYHPDIRHYNESRSEGDRAICEMLAGEITRGLPEADNKIWHAHPVWSLEGNPIVGYSKLKDCIRLMFWSGASFEDNALQPGTGKFKDASVRFTSVDEIDLDRLRNWLAMSRDIQWDYKNLVKRKGILERLR